LLEIGLVLVLRVRVRVRVGVRVRVRVRESEYRLGLGLRANECIASTAADRTLSAATSLEWCFSAPQKHTDN
jgi:hypothetical protein